MDLDALHLDYIRRLVLDSAGLVLDREKEYLIRSRLMPIARSEGLKSLGELVGRLKAQKGGPLHTAVVEAMVTNETFFFRDHHPFDALRSTVIPQLLQANQGQKQIQCWSAACSSGQEPYSLAMLFGEFAHKLERWELKILATDLSERMLTRTREGSYSQIEVNRGLPADKLAKFFEQNGLRWRVRERLRRQLEVRRLNLAEYWARMPAMDLVFMRNVLIYFSPETKKDILERVAKVMKPNGYLFLGAAETVLNLSDRFETKSAGAARYYQLK